MKRKWIALIAAAWFSHLPLPGFSQDEQVWPAVSAVTRPWTRWWWMGSAVDEQNIGELLTAYRKVGMGGVEITPIYGAKGYEPRYLDFLSPKWMSMLRFIQKTAVDLGMGVDLNTGTGWPFGGPQINPEQASSKLVIQSYQVTSGRLFKTQILPQDSVQRRMGATLQGLVAISDQGQRISLLDQVTAEQALSWNPPSGKWTIYAAFNGKTAQLVKRAAPGGEGYVMDHYDKTAVKTYLARFSEAFKQDPVPIDAFFNDSFEVFGADWTATFFDRFQQLKGYDLRLYLRELSGQGEPDTMSRVKSDYRDVLGQLLEENFTQTWHEWAHSLGAKSKNQAHGSPGNLLDLYGLVDIPECEAYFGRTAFAMPGLKRDTADIREDLAHNPLVFQFASSAAHFYGKPLVSSETFVWLTEHFRTALYQCKPEVERLFLAGINHVYFHGSTYSPADVPWPGWTFYASTNFVPANSTWEHSLGLNEYITRCQSVLQAGKADNQLLVYWPIYDLWKDPQGMEQRFGMHQVGEWLFPTTFNQAVQELQGAGYSTDFVSDKMIQALAAGKNQPAVEKKVVLVPACDLMPAATLKALLDLSKSGFTVIFQQLPKDVPGRSDLANQRNQLKQLLQEASGQVLLSPYFRESLEAQGIHREKLTDYGLQFIRRALPDGKYYYVVNHTEKSIDAIVPLNASYAGAMLMNPLDGSSGLAQLGENEEGKGIHLQLQAGEALIIRTYDKQPPAAKPWKYLNPAGAPREIGTDWQVHFTTGGPTLPADQQLKKLVSWTQFPDAAAAAYSGTAVYNTTFQVDDLNDEEYMLQLGEVRESAHVWVNDQDAGILWSVPYQVNIKKYLKRGTNTLKIEVANLMGNRIRDMDRKGIVWRNYHEINFVNIHYRPFSAADWPLLPSGLIGPVTLTAYGEHAAAQGEERIGKIRLHPSVDRKELNKQRRLHPQLWEKAFEFLRSQDLQALPPGKYPIYQDSVFATVAEGPSKTFEVSEWESHRGYMDLQYVIKGKEKIGMSALQLLVERNPYDVKRDVTFWKDQGEGHYYEANPDVLFVFFPKDAHRPNIEVPGYHQVKKIVIKIRTNEP